MTDETQANDPGSRPVDPGPMATEAERHHYAQAMAKWVEAGGDPDAPEEPIDPEQLEDE